MTDLFMTITTHILSHSWPKSLLNWSHLFTSSTI